jgi:predicted dehydrogenase
VSVSIGVIGVGFGTTVHVPAFVSEGLDVAAICSRRPERAEAAARELSIERWCTDWREIVEDERLDAVSIVTPTPMHFEIAMAAVKAGKHVMLEKPFTLTITEAAALAATAREAKVTAMVAHEFRFTSARARAKELIDEGYIGQLRLALLRLIRDPGSGPVPAPYRGERDDFASGMGFIYSLGSHYIDCLRHLFGEVTSVSGELRTLAPERMHEGRIIEVDGDDTFFFRLEFASGGVAQMTASRQALFGEESTIEIFGSEGTLVTPQDGMNPPAHGRLFGARRGDAALERIEIPTRLEPFTDDRDDRLMPFRLLTREFVRGIEEEISPAPNFDDGYACQQIISAVIESSRRGVAVSIPPRG